MSDILRDKLNIGIIAVSLLMSVLSLAGCQGEPIPATTSQVPRIRPQELKKLLDTGEGVIVVDTRDREYYDRSHIPGALSIPLAKTEERQGELPRTMKIVHY